MKVLNVILILFFGIAALTAASQDLTAEGSKNLRSANLHLNGGRYEKALPFYELVLQENPHHVEALNKIGGIYFDMIKDFKKAHEIYVRLVVEVEEIYSEYENLLNSDSKAAQKFHKKYIAKENLDEIRELTPKLIQSCWVKLFKDAQAEFEADNLESSLDHFMYVMEIAPDSIQTLKMISFIYARMEDENQSLAFMEKVAEKDRTDDLVRTQIGNTYFEKGEYQTAIKWYRAAAEVNPEVVDNYFNMALAYEKIHDNENTLKSFQKVLKFEPDNLDAIIFASNLEAEMGNLESSITYLKRAIEIDPSNVDWISFLTYKLAQEKRYQEVLEYAQKWLAAATDPADVKEAQQMINLAKQMLKK